MLLENLDTTDSLDMTQFPLIPKHF